MKTRLLLFAAVGVNFFALNFARAQTPAPVIVQAATTAPAATAPQPAATPAANDFKDLMQLLQQMQAKNAETLHKQEAALQTLDVLEKAAEEIKIFSKRG